MSPLIRKKLSLYQRLSVDKRQSSPTSIVPFDLARNKLYLYPMQDSLLIVGAGRLGQRVGKLWKRGPVTAETQTTRSHAKLLAEQLNPRLRSPEGSFDHVVFCVPPSDSDVPYEEEVVRALSLWNHQGSFVFVSSTAVYLEDSGGVIVESSPVGDSPRATRLLRAESHVTAASGTIIRLAGLYDESSGPHRHYLARETSDLRGDGWINLIHYDDAATLVVQALTNKYPAFTFVGCDEAPITREALVGLNSKMTKGPACRFLGTDGPLGKQCDNTFTRRTLHWKPRWRSFSEFALSQTGIP